MICIGIDPGLTGAVAVIRDDLVLKLLDTPTLKAGSKMHYVASAMAAILLEASQERRSEPIRLGVESQSPRPVQGVKAAFRTGEGWGVWLAVIQLSGISYEELRPQQWQGIAGVLKKSGKEGAGLIAARLFPDAELRTPRGRLIDGRADALCIAEAVRRRNVSSQEPCQ